MISGIEVSLNLGKISCTRDDASLSLLFFLLVLSENYGKKFPLLKALMLLTIGVKHVSGDMFKEVPSGDAVFMKVSYI